MKTSNWLIAGILGVLILFSACSKIYINVVSKSPDIKINSENLKTAIVVGINGVSLNEFTQTFNKRYKQDRDFINEYTNLFTDKLQMGKLFTQVKCDTSNCWSLIKSFTGVKEDFKIIDSLFNNCSYDYIINLNNFEISNRTQTFSSGGVTNMPMSTSTTEYCIVRAQFQIIDKKTRKGVLEFKSTGESSVFLFAFDLALKKAMTNSIDHAIAYLRTGQINFKK